MSGSAWDKLTIGDDTYLPHNDLAVAHYSDRMRSIIQRLGGYLLGLIADPEEKPARFILPYDNELLAARFGCTKEGLVHGFSRLQRIGAFNLGLHSLDLFVSPVIFDQFWKLAEAMAPTDTEIDRRTSRAVPKPRQHPVVVEIRALRELVASNLKGLTRGVIFLAVVLR
jgi:hypothetical protein